MTFDAYADGLKPEGALPADWPDPGRTEAHSSPPSAGRLSLTLTCNHISPGAPNPLFKTLTRRPTSPPSTTTLSLASLQRLRPTTESESIALL